METAVSPVLAPGLIFPPALEALDLSLEFENGSKKLPGFRGRYPRAQPFAVIRDQPPQCANPFLHADLIAPTQMPPH
jgi:hypothetical protein